MKCKICELEFDNKRAFATHLQTGHSLKAKEYTYGLLLGLDAEPTCAHESCNNEVRYVSFTFRKYCKEHARMAMRAGGKAGGITEAWNKGKTKHNSQALREQSEASIGSGNHFYGKKHTPSSRDKMYRSSLMTEELFCERVSSREGEFECTTAYSDYVSRQHQHLNFICRVCNTPVRKTLQAYERGSQCKKCFPQSSKPEQEVADFIIRELNKETKNKIKKLNEARLLHGDKYDYSGVNYTRTTDKVIVGCPLHGEFRQEWREHCRGHGCPKCAPNAPKTFEDFIESSRDVHGSKYIYDKSTYKNVTTKTQITCREHGTFQMKPSTHVHSKQGCKECGLQTVKDKLSMSREEFIEKAEKVHGKTYDYSEAVYENVLNKIEIKCPEHGVFTQKAGNHINNDAGCPKCVGSGPSKPEQEVADFIKNISPDVLTSDRTLIAPKELDVYVPSKNFAVEFNGLYWHTLDFVTKKYHKEKTEACASKGVQLFHIFSDEWRDKRSIVESMIRHRLGVTSRRIFARKCVLKEVTSEESRNFFDQTHIAGKTRYKKAFGLYFEGELVSCVSVKKPIQKKHGDNVLEISRFASSLNTVVVGGFQKIFKKVLEYARQENYEKILTYADRRFSEGGAYQKAGFEQLPPTSTGYFYTDGKVRYFRFKYRAQQPKPENNMVRLTEKQVANNAKVSQIHDCGHNVFLLKL